jgi:hypothetical protein
VSPDARWVLYRSDESGKFELYVQPLPPNGQKWRISNAGVDDFQWRGDGREIFYIAKDTLTSVEVQVTGSSFQPRPPKALFKLPALRRNYRNRFVATRDGQRLLVAVAEQARDEREIPFVVIMNWPRLLENGK